MAEPELATLTSVNHAEFPILDAGRDLASLMFTSGSTGAPKGVMVSHRNIEVNARDIVGYMGLTPEDRVMVVLPFNYCFGLSLLHTHLMAGATLVLNNQFMYPENVLLDMQDKACTGIAGVPSTYQILLRKSRLKEMSFPELRWIQQAGGKLPNPFIQEIRSAFPQVRYYLMYGQTEATARLSYLPPERLLDKLGSIGKAPWGIGMIRRKLENTFAMDDFIPATWPRSMQMVSSSLSSASGK
jgi:acyl-CoA synthetase (AMP-forming)/AMP-acid ligase II